jgi:hypothetical protein
MINGWLWAGLFTTYFILDGIGTKNIIATNKLDRITASNSSALMYLFGIVGSYICVTDGLINLIPILAGAWLGTFSAITWEIKILKRSKVATYKQKTKVRRPGIQAKTKQSSNKNSKNYVKQYVGQGR